jgi:hypothetical protein
MDMAGDLRLHPQLRLAQASLTGGLLKQVVTVLFGCWCGGVVGFLGVGRCGEGSFDAVGEVISGVWEVQVWFAEVAGSDCGGDEGHETGDCCGAVADGGGLLGQVVQES